MTWKDDVWGVNQEQNVPLKDLKRMIKKLGYRFKTEVVGFRKPYRALEVLDQDGEFVCGSGANVYTQDTIDEHREIFDLLNKYRDRVYDKDGLKVLF